MARTDWSLQFRTQMNSVCNLGFVIANVLIKNRHCEDDDDSFSTY